MGAKGDDLVFLVDSESPNSPGYSPPGQIYNEAIKGVLEVFRTGESVMEGPAADRWGTFYSALVPVKDLNSGQVIAVFGLDFDASEWHADLLHQMNREIIISVLFILFVIAFCRSGYHYLKLKELSDKTTVKEALYRSMFEQAPVGIAIVNDKSFATQSEFGNASMNPAFEKILGRTYRELSNTSWPEITYPDDLQIDLDEFEKFKTGEIDCYTIEKRFLRPDGSYVWTFMKVVHFLEGLRDNPMHLCLLVDITEERNISNSLSESERSKSVLLSNLPGMAYRSSIDRDWTIRVVSAGCYDLTGYTPESLIDNRDLSYNDVIAPEYREILWNEWEYILNEKQRFKLEYEIITASGERKWVTDIGKGIVDEKGEMKAVEGIVFDISEQKNAENRLIYNYEHDSLTGLYSRDYFDNLLIKDHKAKSVKKRALIGVNLSTLQTLSTTYGFHYTQELIKNIAVVLRQYSAEDRILIKTYENRFVLYVKNYNDFDELMEISRKMAESLESILAVERVSGGIGILEVNPDEAPDLNKLSKTMSILSEKAIDLSENGIGICCYDDKTELQIAREEVINRELTDIAASEEDGSLYLQYQPILDLKTNSISGFEALARLKTEDLGKVMPSDFIYIAERTKLIIPIGWKIVRQAFSFINKLKSLGYDNTFISINFSVIQLMKDDFIDSLFEMIDEMQVNPENICIEITESVFASGYDDINKIMDRIRNFGLSVAIDDFGTGYSSLSRERELNTDCVKIDKYFIDKLMDVSHVNAITGDIISIAHKLGHYTVAEGVEYEEQKHYLLEYGCDKIQGYLIEHPLDEEAAIDMLNNQTSALCGC